MDCWVPGLRFPGTGQVRLGSGTLTNNDFVSGINGGSLTAAYQFVGIEGERELHAVGRHQRDGNYLYLGYGGTGDNGTYVLGGGRLSALSQFIGYSGTGSLMQSGGANRGNGGLFLGNNAGSNGTYRT